MEKPHKKLDVWNSALDLVVLIYKTVRLLPEEERYNLASQMKQAACSIPANIAEGAARNTKKEFAHFLHIAQGSLSELDTHLEVAKRVGLLRQEELNAIDALMERVDKMLTGLIRRQKTPDAFRLPERKQAARSKS